MQIVLTEDVSKVKGWTKGRAFDWPRPTISAISQSLGRKDWFEWGQEVSERTNSAAMRRRRKQE